MALKNKKKTNFNGKPNRKQMRKEQRKSKKVKRNEYFNKKGKKPAGAELKILSEKIMKDMGSVKKQVKARENSNQLDTGKNYGGNKILSTEELHKKEKKEQKRIQKDMSRQRRDQLLKANEKEDRLIKKLEKQLNMHKRKTKSVPKSFVADGLDYLLEVCDQDYMKNATSTEQDLNDANDNFEEDFALMTGQTSNNTKKKSTDENYSDTDSTKDISDEDYKHDYDIDEFSSDDEVEVMEENSNFESDESSEENNFDSELDGVDSEEEDVQPKKVKQKRKLVNEDEEHDIYNTPQKKVRSEDSDDELHDDSGSVEDTEKKEVWEDIYGRLRLKDGSLVKNSEGKYIPPAIRAKMEQGSSEDKKRREKLDRLKKQLKGLLNRLAESNMHSIAVQIEDLFMNNSRNDMNESLTSLIMDSLVSNVMTPERLLMEHILLISILHANIGSEVGAHFLQTTIKKFDTLSKSNQAIEDKSLDNTVNILAQLYNFKVYDAKLLYEILQRLAIHFEEKNVECILHILRSVGFGLRKDDPLALKNLILELQRQAASVSEGKVNNSRVKFLLDVLLAIKNNNVTKIPNYDTSYSEHLKKIMKGFVRKGNYVAPLNISLEDLLKADERGKWWVIGSAWTGNKEITTRTEKTTKSDTFSQKLLDLAKKQRMNTDTRRDIFCIIMSAEDYLDAFEKLLRLGLKNQQEREIIHVILHCCLQEKIFNPYYAVLAQKFCEYERKFQMTIKCSVWDKLKTLNSHSGGQLSNLAKLLTHLFIEKGLPISTLKIVEFSELDKTTLRLMRQILLGILLHNDLEAVQGVFEKVAQSDKLKMFRESLRLFIHHFLLRNLKSDVLPNDQKQRLEERATMVEKILAVKDSKLRL